MSDVLAGLGARSAPIESTPENLTAAQRQGWERATIGSVKKDDSTVLVIALPPRAGDLEGAELGGYARTNPLIVMAWSNTTTGFSQLTDQEREAVIRSLENGTTFGHEMEILVNEGKIAEFSAGLDELFSGFRFNPAGALYELYKSGVFTYVDSQEDEQLKEGYTDALMDRLSGVEGLDFQTALDEEKEFHGFLQGSLSLMFDGDFYDACLYSMTQFAREGVGSRLSDLMASAIGEYAGIPQELLREKVSEWAPRLSGSGQMFSRDELRELLNDDRVQRPSAELQPGQADESQSARALRFFMADLNAVEGMADPQKEVAYARLYNLWDIVQNPGDMLQNTAAFTMAREFFRATGLEIGSNAVRTAWEENPNVYAMR